MVVVTVDMPPETTVHIVERTAVAVGAGYTWAADVSFRRMKAAPHPDVVSVVNTGLMSPAA